VLEDFVPEVLSEVTSKPHQQPQQPNRGIIIYPQNRKIPFTVHHCGSIFHLSVRYLLSLVRNWNF
jgi:hypothetical protein